jgi:hypothetical protein
MVGYQFCFWLNVVDVNAAYSKNISCVTQVTMRSDFHYDICVVIKTTVMKLNMGSADRIIRLLIVVAIVVLYFTHVIEGTTALVAWILGGVFLLTSIVGFCPLYTIFKIKTRK